MTIDPHSFIDHRVQVEDATLTTKVVPASTRSGRRRVERWRKIIDKFLQMGDTSMLVEIPGIKATGIYTGLHNEIKRSKEKRCYPTVVNKAECYLVRVPARTSS